MGNTSELSDFDRREIAILLHRWMRIIINRTVGNSMSKELSSRLAKFLEEHEKFVNGKLRTCDRIAVHQVASKFEAFVAGHFTESELSSTRALRLLHIVRNISGSHYVLCHNNPAFFVGSGIEYYLLGLRKELIYWHTPVTNQDNTTYHSKIFEYIHTRWLIALWLLRKVERVAPKEFEVTISESIESFIEGRFDGFALMLYADWLEEKGKLRRAHRIRRGVGMLEKLDDKIRAAEGISRSDSTTARIG